MQRNSHAPTRNIQPNRTRRVQVPCRGNHTRRPRTANRAESEKSRCRAVEVARADQKQVRPLRCAVARRRMLGRAFKSSRGAIVACNVKPLRQRQQVERIWEWTIELPSVGASIGPRKLGLAPDVHFTMRRRRAEEIARADPEHPTIGKHSDEEVHVQWKYPTIGERRARRGNRTRRLKTAKE